LHGLILLLIVLLQQSKIHKFEKWGSIAMMVGVLAILFDPLSRRVDYNQV
jgi:hypothetical protein